MTLDAPTSPPLFTVVAPMRNEAANVAALAAEIAAACAAIGPFEAIFVNDGSTDATSARIAETRAAHPWLREVRHMASCGQSAAVRSGVRAARAPIICTLDGDGQNPPAEIPRLLAPLLDPAAPARLALVAGQRVGRRDTASRRLASRVANAVRRTLLNDDVRDTGCGLKAFRREAFLDLPFFDHMHRYLPALFKRDGWELALIDVSHRARAAGASNYTNLGRALVGAVDLIGVWWLCRRRKTPVVMAEDA
jgi:dolichol-phosphate mannosyltransferase